MQEALEAVAETIKTEKKGDKPKETKEKKKGGRKAAVKITRFDKAVADLVVGGVQSVSAIRDKLRIDPKQFDARLKTLLRAGFFAVDEQNPDVIRFGIKGFNAFAKKTSIRKPRGEKATEATQAALPIAQQIIHFQKPEARKAEEQEKEIDLIEAFAKGAPKEGKETREVKRYFTKRVEEPRKGAREAIEEIPVPNTAGELKQAIEKERGEREERDEREKNEKSALIVGGKEVCELCKAGFKLSVSGGNPKYGHCFCGAAYHKDCYESLVDDSGKCIRCGKKLKLEMSKKSEEAVKQIREVFD